VCLPSVASATATGECQWLWVTSGKGGTRRAGVGYLVDAYQDLSCQATTLGTGRRQCMCICMGEGREEDEKPTAVTAGSEVNAATGEGGDPL
jgi:hypothetical protein